MIEEARLELAKRRELAQIKRPVEASLTSSDYAVDPE
jgi:hypothetical protein